MKKSIVLMLVIVFSLTYVSVPISAREAVNVEQIEIISKSQNKGEISPRIIHRYEKTVVNFYDTYPVPASINYREYDMASWFSGTLYLKKVEPSGSKWKATYVGILTGVI